MAKQGKRLKAIYAGFDRDAVVPLVQAIGLAKANAKAKFDETIEISMNLGIDPRHADQMVRGVVGLPNGTGKTVRVGVFARGAKAEEALAAGADVVGADELAAAVQEGKIEFDRCIATPDMMGLVGRLGKILGADDVGAGGRRLVGLGPAGEDGDADGLAGAVRQVDHAADHLVGVARVDAEVHRDLEGLVELRCGIRLDQL